MLHCWRAFSCFSATAGGKWFIIVPYKLTDYCMNTNFQWWMSNSRHSSWFSVWITTISIHLTLIESSGSAAIDPTVCILLFDGDSSGNPIGNGMMVFGLWWPNYTVLNLTDVSCFFSYLVTFVGYHAHLFNLQRSETSTFLICSVCILYVIWYNSMVYPH